MDDDKVLSSFIESHWYFWRQLPIIIVNLEDCRMSKHERKRRNIPLLFSSFYTAMPQPPLRVRALPGLLSRWQLPSSSNFYHHLKWRVSPYVTAMTNWYLKSRLDIFDKIMDCNADVYIKRSVGLTPSFAGRNLYKARCQLQLSFEWWKYVY